MVANAIKREPVSMISVVIATHDSECALVATLAALVPGALDGLVREVIVADAGSHDGTDKVADVAGARFVQTLESLGARLKSSAAMARGPWLLFLRPGVVPEVTWVEEAGSFVRDSQLAARNDLVAAVFRPRAARGGRRAALREALTLAAAALGAPARPAQGLLIAKLHYDVLGGHRADTADPETDLLRRIGRRRIVMLRSAAVTAVE
jgi:glycosyltransferase involved in cell wall biosynthesis